MPGSFSFTIARRQRRQGKRKARCEHFLPGDLTSVFRSAQMEQVQKISNRLTPLPPPLVSRGEGLLHIIALCSPSLTLSLFQVEGEQE